MLCFKSKAFQKLKTEIKNGGKRYAEREERIT